MPTDPILAKLHGILQTRWVGITPRSRLVYVYDMGDSWEHSVVVEKRLPVDLNATYPRCMGGGRAYPPEDCGSLPGFYELLEAIRNPEDERHKELLELREKIGSRRQ